MQNRLVTLLVVALVTASVGAVATATSTNQQSQQQQERCDFEGLYDRSIDSVVSVRVATQDGQFGQGSGFLYRQSLIVTNQHVVANTSSVEVQFDRGEWRTARVVGSDPYSDLAVLRVQNVPGYAEPLPLAEQRAEPGEPVAALGSPLGLQGSITQGVVSGLNRTIPSQRGFSIPDGVQTDAPINPGNSGGPLVNCAGRVVGVNTAGIQGGENLGFAIPTEVIRRVVPSLVQNGSYSHAFLGISSLEVSPIVAQANDLQRAQGVLVVNTLPNGPAGGVLQGSQQTQMGDGTRVPVGGDVIVSVEGTPVQSGEDLSSVLAERRPGDTVSMTIVRDGERQTVRVTLGERPPPNATATTGARDLPVEAAR
ncbi:S1C family serine protease [Halomicrococcus gelatinilyticus]|uniref:S1C family serine protease n=1 Tax=Halomicrococcus gelatinilyticus TaxID=1702103 RepID=UPI002E104EA8